MTASESVSIVVFNAAANGIENHEKYKTVLKSLANNLLVLSVLGCRQLDAIQWPKLSQPYTLLITSRNAVSSLSQLAFPPCLIYCVGANTLKVFEESGLFPGIERRLGSGNVQSTIETILSANAKVFVVWPCVKQAGDRDSVFDLFDNVWDGEQPIKVSEQSQSVLQMVRVYESFELDTNQWLPDYENFEKHSVLVHVYTSPAIFRAVHRVLPNQLDALHVAIGNTTAQAIKLMGLNVNAIARIPSPNGIFDAIKSILSNS